MDLFLRLSLWALAFVPLIVDSSVFFPFIYGKTFFIRAAIFIVSALFFAHFLSRKSFREHIYLRMREGIRNPLVVSLLAFMLVVGLSTLFAVSPFRAFFGDVERGEGFLGIFSFFAFFVYSYLIFEKKDWLVFFKLNIVTGIILFRKAMVEMGEGSTRPGSYTGNPEFLAGYFLFVLFAALVIFKNSSKSDPWKYISLPIVALSVVVIFITQTRGTMLALVAGAIAMMVYGMFYGGSVKFAGKLSARHFCMIFLGLLAVFSVVFFETRSADIWQNVPGLSRVAIFNTKDISYNTRLISLGISADAINPKNSGWDRFLIGYGPDNFNIAYNAHFDPSYYFYEHVWFDRAHNKIMDIGVMHGIAGLLTYMAIWGSFIYLIFKRKNFSFEMMAVLFFGAAYFTHNLTVFDQISTYVPFFGVLAFLSFLSTGGKDDGKNNGQLRIKNMDKSLKDGIAIALFGVVSVWFLVMLIFWTAIPYFQMREYLNLIKKGDGQMLLEKADDVFEPYTFAQQDMRNHFLSLMVGNYSNNTKPLINNLFDKAIFQMEDFVAREPWNPRFYLLLGQAYDAKYAVGRNLGDAKKAEENYREGLKLVPLRQDISYVLALNLANQKRFDEAVEILQKEIAADERVPETYYYLGTVLVQKGDEKDYVEAMENTEKAFKIGLIYGIPSNANALYQRFISYFYRIKDRDNFLIAMDRLEKLVPEYKKDFDKVRDLINKDIWPQIDFL